MALKAKQKLVLDDIEIEIVKKYRDIGIPTAENSKKKRNDAKKGGKFGEIFGDGYNDEGYTGNFIKKRGLID